MTIVSVLYLLQVPWEGEIEEVNNGSVSDAVFAPPVAEELLGDMPISNSLREALRERGSYLPAVASGVGGQSDLAALNGTSGLDTAELSAYATAGTRHFQQIELSSGSEGVVAYSAQNFASGYAVLADTFGTQISDAEAGARFIPLSICRGEGVTHVLTVPVAVCVEEALVEWDYGSGIVHWADNQPDGLRHWFNLSQRPEGEGPLRVDMQILTPYALRLDSSGKRVIFHGGEEPRLSYEELRVWDADGRLLDAHFELEESLITVVVADATARYPLTIDPIVRNVSSAVERKQGLSGVGDFALGDRFAAVGFPGWDFANTYTVDDFVGDIAGGALQLGLGLSDAAGDARGASSAALGGMRTMLRNMFKALGWIDTTIRDVGAVTVFAKTDSGWQMAQLLQHWEQIARVVEREEAGIYPATFRPDKRRFGQSLDISNNWLMVGEPGYSPNQLWTAYINGIQRLNLGNADTGRVYFYDLYAVASGNVNTQMVFDDDDFVQNRDGDDQYTWTQVGQVVAVSGERAVALSGPRELTRSGFYFTPETPTLNASTIHCFRFADGKWQLEDTRRSGSDLAGTVVDMKIAGEDVYLLRWNQHGHEGGLFKLTDRWNQRNAPVQVDTHPGGNDSRYSTLDVWVDSEGPANRRIVVGAATANEVRIYDASGQRTATVQGEEGEMLGRSVAVWQDALFATSGESAGEVHLWFHIGGQWEHQTQFGGAGSNQFGRFLATNRQGVGALFDEGGTAFGFREINRVFVGRVLEEGADGTQTPMAQASIDIQRRIDLEPIDTTAFQVRSDIHRNTLVFDSPYSIEPIERVELDLQGMNVPRTQEVDIYTFATGSVETYSIYQRQYDAGVYLYWPTEIIPYENNPELPWPFRESERIGIVNTEGLNQMQRLSYWPDSPRIGDAPTQGTFNLDFFNREPEPYTVSDVTLRLFGYGKESLTTDNEGRFRVDDLTAALYAVSASDLPYMSEAFGYDLHNNFVIEEDIVLRPSNTVSGLIYFAHTGQPASGLTVRSSNGETTTVGVDGRFLLEQQGGSIAIHVEGADSFDLLEAELNAPHEPATGPDLLTLAPWLYLAGGIEGVDYTIQGPLAVNGSTDASGQIWLHLVPPGTYQFNTTDEAVNNSLLGYGWYLNPARVTHFGGGDRYWELNNFPYPTPIYRLGLRQAALSNQTRSVDASSGNVGPLVLYLMPRGEITGSVATSEGTAVAGATVNLQFPDGTQVSTVTDASGNYSIARIPPGDYSVTVRHPVYSFTDTISHTQSAGAQSTLSPIITPTHSVTFQLNYVETGDKTAQLIVSGPATAALETKSYGISAANPITLEVLEGNLEYSIILADHVFTPSSEILAIDSSQSVSVTGRQYFELSGGFVVSGDEGVPFVTIDVQGPLGGLSTESTVDGTYSITVPSGRDVIITPSAPGLRFQPASYTLTVDADSDIVNFIPAAGLDLSVDVAHRDGTALPDLQVTLTPVSEPVFRQAHAGAFSIGGANGTYGEYGGNGDTGTLEIQSYGRIANGMQFHFPLDFTGSPVREWMSYALRKDSAKYQLLEQTQRLFAWRPFETHVFDGALVTGTWTTRPFVYNHHILGGLEAGDFTLQPNLVYPWDAVNPETTSTLVAGQSTYTARVFPQNYALTFSHPDYYFEPETLIVGAYETAPELGWAVTAHPNSISGTVTFGASSIPQAGVEIRLDGSDGLVTTTTDADGFYRFEPVESGDYTVSAYHESYVFESSTRTVTVQSEAVSGVDFSIALQAVDVPVESRYAGLSNGLDLEGATVAVSDARFNALTESSGNILRAYLPKGDYQITLSRDGYDSATESISVGLSNVSLTPVNLDPSVAYSVSGTLLDAGGHPSFPGQTIQIVGTPTGASDDTYSRTIAVGSNGSFEFANVPNGAYTLALAAELPNHSVFPAAQSIQVNASSVNLQPFVAKNFSLSGTVVNSSGTPISGVTLQLDGDGNLVTRTTALDGRFSFTNLRSADYTLTPELAPYGFDPIREHITIGVENPSAVQFVGRAGGIQGLVTLRGEPMSGVTIRYISGGQTFETSTDATGAYALPTVPVGTGTLDALSGDHRFENVPRSVTVADGATERQDFASRLFQIQVLFGTENTSIEGAEVTITGPENRIGTTNAAGSVEFTDLLPGLYTISVQHTDYLATQISDPVSGESVRLRYKRLTKGEGASAEDAVNILAERTTRISGKLVDISGNPVEGATLVVYDHIPEVLNTPWTGTEVARTSSAEDGSYAFQHLSSQWGRLSIVIEPDGFTYPNNPYAIPTVASAYSDVDFTGTQWQPVQGTVTLGSGELQGQSVFDLPIRISGVVQGVAYSKETQTDASGNYMVLAPPMEFLRVEPIGTGFRYTADPVGPTYMHTIDAPLTVDFAMNGNRTVSGMVTFGGAALSGVNFTGQGQTSMSDGDGKYTVANLFPGVIRITPSLTGYQFDPVVRDVDVIDSSATGVNFAATGSGFIEGRVIDEEGQPVADATVVLDQGFWVESRIGEQRTTTDANGSFVLTNVPPQAGDWMIEKSGYRKLGGSVQSSAAGLDLGDLISRKYRVETHNAGRFLQFAEGTALQLPPMGALVASSSGWTVAGWMRLPNRTSGSSIMRFADADHSIEIKRAIGFEQNYGLYIDGSFFAAYTLPDPEQAWMHFAISVVPHPTIPSLSRYTLYINGDLETIEAPKPASGSYDASTIRLDGLALDRLYFWTRSLNQGEIHEVMYADTALYTDALYAAYLFDADNSLNVADMSGNERTAILANPGIGYSRQSTQVTTYVDEPVRIDLIGSSERGALLNYEILDGGPSQGTLVAGEAGIFHYTPDSGFVGTDSFSYRVAGSLFTGEPVSVQVDVIPEVYRVTFNSENQTAGESVNITISAPRPAPFGGITLDLEATTEGTAGSFTLPATVAIPAGADSVTIPVAIDSTANSYRLEVSIKGVLDETANLRIQPDLAPLEGTVRRSSNAEPFVGVTVTARDGENTWTSTTDATGRFAFAGVPRGSLEVSVAIDGYSFPIMPFTVELDDSTESIDFIGTGDRVVDGQVWNGNQPVRGAEVLLSNGAKTVTDPAGRFAFENVDPGVYTLNVLAAGFAVAPIDTTVDLSNGDARELEFHATSNLDRLEMLSFLTDGINVVRGTSSFRAIEQSGTLGELLADKGPGVTYPAAIHSAEENARARQVVPASGLYALGLRYREAEAAWYWVSGEKAVYFGWDSASLPANTVGAALAPDGSWVPLTADSPVDGFIEEREPTRANLYLRQFVGEATPVALLSDNPLLADLPPFVVVESGENWASVPVYTKRVDEPETVTLTARLNGQDVSTSLTVYPPTVISGEIVDTAGRPVAGVAVDVGSTRLLSGVDGKYSYLAAPNDGVVSVVVSKPGYLFNPTSRTVDTSESTNAVDFVGSGLYSVAGDVQIASSVRVEGAVVSVGPFTGTVQDGSFAVTGIPPGIYTVSLTHPGYRFVPSGRQVEITESGVQLGTFIAEGALRISGTITDANGSSLSGVSVRLTGPQVDRSVTTASDGQYAFTDLEPLDYTVRPDAADRLMDPSVQVLRLVDSDLVADFTANPTEISGLVLDGTGQPISGVTVQAGGQTAITDSTGAYRIQGLSRGSYIVELSHPTLSLFPASREVLVGESSITDLDFIQSTGLSGRVTDASDGGVSGVEVTLNGTASIQTRSITDSTSGQALVSEGTVERVFRIPDEGTVAGLRVAVDLVASQQGVLSLYLISPGNDIFDLIRLNSVGTVQGIYGSGVNPVDPLSNANGIEARGEWRLVAQSRDGDGLGFPVSTPWVGTVGAATLEVDLAAQAVNMQTQTAADGSYRFVVRPGDYIISASRPPLTIDPSQRNLTVGVEPTSDLDFNVTSDFLSGQVTDTDGAPVSGATINVLGYPEGIQSTTTLAGDITIESGHSQAISLPVSDSGEVGDLAVFISVTRSFGSQLDISLEAPDGTTVQLLTDGGSAFSGTFGDGLTAHGSLEGFAGVELKGTWKLHLDNFQWSGQVRDFELRVQTRGELVQTDTTTDANGFYQIPLSRGNYTIHPSYEDYRFSPAERELAYTPSTGPANFTREPWTGIEGVLTRQGVAVGGYTVSLTTTELGTQSVMTESDGTFRIAFSPGTHSIQWDAGDLATWPAQQSIELANGERFALDLELAAPQSISGTLLDSNGVPLSGVRLEAGNRFANTVSDGTFILGPFDNGAVELSIAGGTYGLSGGAVAVTVADGDINALQLTAEPLYSISGRVTDFYGEPVEGAELFLEPANIRGLSESDGTFRLNSIYAGDYVLRGNSAKIIPKSVSVENGNISDVTVLLEPYRVLPYGRYAWAKDPGYMELPVPNDLQNGDGFVASAWIRLDASSTDTTLFYLENNNEDTIRLYRRSGDGRLILRIEGFDIMENSYTEQTWTGPVLPLEAWTHVGLDVTFDAMSSQVLATFLVHGEEVGYPEYVTFGSGTFTTFRLGADAMGNNALVGAVDEVCVIAGRPVGSAQERAFGSVENESLWLHYSFESAIGEMVSDSSGNGRSADWVGTAPRSVVGHESTIYADELQSGLLVEPILAGSEPTKVSNWTAVAPPHAAELRTEAAGFYLTGDDVAAGSDTFVMTAQLGGLAPEAEVSYTVKSARLDPSVVWNPPASVAYGSDMVAALDTVQSAVPGAASFDPALDAIGPVGIYPIRMTFIPDALETYQTVVLEHALEVSRASAPVSAPASFARRHGELLNPEALGLSASIEGSWFLLGTEVDRIGTRALQARFVPSDVRNYAIQELTVPVTTRANLDTFAAYSASYGLSATVDPNRRTDGSGLPLLVAYALGADPTEPLPAALRPRMIPAEADSLPAFRYPVAKDATSGVLLRPIRSDDLGTWEDVSSEAVTVGADSTHSYKEVPFPATGTKAFFNLEAEERIINDPPVLTLVRPVEAITLKVGQALQVEASAVDPDGDGVSFAWSLIDSNDQIVSTVSGGTTSLIVSESGNYRLVLSGVDARGMPAAVSPEVLVTVVDNQAPTISLAGGSSYSVTKGNSQTFRALVSDPDDLVSTLSVVFYFASDPEQSYAAPHANNFQWSQTFSTVGTFQLVARVEDPLGATATTAATVTVVEPVPSIEITSPTDMANFTTMDFITFNATVQNVTGDVSWTILDPSMGYSVYDYTGNTFDYQLVDAGTYTVTASIAIDAQTVISDSITIEITGGGDSGGGVGGGDPGDPSDPGGGGFFP
jgi:protocatechuate 3,4-dioxygenase beta subunit/subtilisin-like proprotein convertase family protein